MMPCACGEARRLRDRVEQLEELLGFNEAPPAVRPRRVGVVLGLLARREMVSKSTVRLALDSEDMSDRQVDVYVSGARKWLRGHGFTLQVEYGKGWYLPARERAALAGRLALLREVSGGAQGEIAGASRSEVAP